MKKSLLALAVALSAVSGANAAWQDGFESTNRTLGNGEALFIAYDTVAGVSYARDLGVRYNDLFSGAAFNGQSFTVDLSVFAASAIENVSWQIVAGSGKARNDANTVNDVSNLGFITTIDSDPSDPASVPTASNWSGTTNINTRLTQLNTVNNILGMTTGDYAENGSVTEAVANGPQYIGEYGNFMAAAYSLDANGSIGNDTLTLWRYGFDTAALASKSVVQLGTATLSGNTLTLGTAPTVPVPAAAWLMGSALVGLAGVARRRNKA